MTSWPAARSAAGPCASSRTGSSIAMITRSRRSAAEAHAQLLADELSFDDGVDLAQMLPIAVNAVAFAEDRHVGGPTVVFGCGPIGLLVAQVARATGAGPVYAVDRVTQRLDIARWLGLEPIAAEGDVAAALKERLGVDAIAVAFECSGSA